METYDLELDKAIEAIQKSKAKRVLVQLPDGLKPKAKEIVDTLSEKTKAHIDIWAGSCYGACDVPNVDYDILIQWGHSEWI